MSSAEPQTEEGKVELRKIPKAKRFQKSLCGCCAPARKHQYDDKLRCVDCGLTWYQIREKELNDAH